MTDANRKEVVAVDHEGKPVHALPAETTVIKVFAMNDCDWYAARSLDEAKASYARTVHSDNYDVAEDKDGIFDDPYELTAEQMDRLRFWGDADEPSKTPITFREQLSKMVADGDSFPCFFASTEY